jgi:uncharacterized protein (TIGR02145 family)
MTVSLWISGYNDDPEDDPNAPVKDIDENTYTKITIGQQIWLKENLTTTRFTNGDVLSNIRNTNAWRNTGASAWCNYDNVDANNVSYAKLYNWTSVNRGDLCPNGWHVPDKAEWEKLITQLGGEAVAGGKMKSMQNWSSPNEGATNESNFTALPAGKRKADGGFEAIAEEALFWSSSFDPSGKAWLVILQYDDMAARLELAEFNTGASVRCVKD